MAQEITPAFYWDLSDLPKFVKGELNRRISSQQGKPNYSDSSDYAINKYTHPVAAWVRVCSNAVDSNKQGFVMNGTNLGGFKSKHGFLPDGHGSTLGYTADGKVRHYIENERFKHRPSPGIMSVNTELNGGDGKFRITTIKWKCWSTDQLVYMTPYWLTNGVSVSVEFGWNNFNPMSSLELNDLKLMLKYFYDGTDIQEKIALSNGNYDASMGIITKFNYILKDDGSYDCTTIVSNVGGYFSGVYSAGRTSQSSESADTLNPQWKKYVESYMPDFLLNAAKRNHEIKKETIFSQVFYSREKNIDPSRGNKSNNDFDRDSNNENFWISFGLFIAILNNKMSVMDNNTGNPIFSINIDDTIIGGHPNLKSSDGSVLLIPNSTCPDISIGSTSMPNLPRHGRSANSTKPVQPANIIVGQTNGSDAQEILNNLHKNLNSKSSSRVDVISYDLNKIINWWASNPEELAFPSKINTDRLKSGKNGYLKNLYINFNVIRDLKSQDSFKSILVELLKRVSRAAGDLWDFEIVPINPDGSGNGILTIIDKNYNNLVDTKKFDLWNFDFNNNLSIIKSMDFSVGSTDAVANQTLFGVGSPKIVNSIIIPSSDKSVDQVVSIPLGISIKDRLLSGCKEVPPIVSDKKSTLDKEEKDPMQDRIICPEAKPLRFLYTYGNRTFSLVEPVQEIQKGLIYQGNKNEIRLYSVQPGIEVKITIDGISGLRNLHTFTINDLPPPYGPDCFFQIKNVEHVILDGMWNTVITGAIRRRPQSLK